MSDPTIVILTIILALLLFIWGKFRHDIVAIITLLILVATGIISADEAFLGFGHPAVITVAVVLIVSKGLESTGVVDALGRLLLRNGYSFSIQLLLLCIPVAVMSAFMNNVGALALIMPIGILVARKNRKRPSDILMPLAFVSLLGGMATMIGTPPNIIISSIRSDYLAEPYGIFDFFPVGGLLTIIGVIFVAFVGWRLMPKREPSGKAARSYISGEYTSHAVIDEDSALVGVRVETLIENYDESIKIITIRRNNKRLRSRLNNMKLRGGDIITIKAVPKALMRFLDENKLVIVGEKKFRGDISGSSIKVMESVIMHESPLIGSTAHTYNLRGRYGMNLLAISRVEPLKKLLNEVKLVKGDLIIVKSLISKFDRSLNSLKLYPIGNRKIQIGSRRNIILSVGIFLLAVLSIILGIFPVHIAFTVTVALYVILRLLPLEDLYSSVDWSVIVLLGAMIPVGAALESSGAVHGIVSNVLPLLENLPSWITLGLILFLTLMLSGVINNVTTVVLMAPIAIGVAKGIGVSLDPFLMAVAVGASSAFLSPIGHQSNTLVMGPGGYRFTDYIRLGIPMSILVLLVAVPLILIFFPL